MTDTGGVIDGKTGGGRTCCTDTESAPEILLLSTLRVVLVGCCPKAQGERDMGYRERNRASEGRKGREKEGEEREGEKGREKEREEGEGEKGREKEREEGEGEKRREKEGETKDWVVFQIDVGEGLQGQPGGAPIEEVRGLRFRVSAGRIANRRGSGPAP